MARYAERHYADAAMIFRLNRPLDHWDANKRVQHNLLLRGFVELFEGDNVGFVAERFIAVAGGYAYEG